jgi:hypothetical protein
MHTGAPAPWRWLLGRRDAIAAERVQPQFRAYAEQPATGELAAAVAGQRGAQSSSVSGKERCARGGSR